MDAATKLLTVPEVAERLRTTAETLKYWRQQGRGPRSVRIGRRVLYAEDDVMSWIEEQYTQPRTVA